MNAPAIQKPAPITAADVRACIRNHFGANGERYATLFEVRNGTAWRANRSVDAVVMGLWPSLGMELWGMEIKVSKWDWRRELNQPAKASEVFDHFDRFFLVCPEGVAEPSELPEPWGWFIAKPGEGLVKRREAAKNPNVKAVDRHFLGALLRNVGRKDDAALDAMLGPVLKEQRRLHEQEIDKRVLERLGDMREKAEAWSKLHDLLKTKPDDWVYQPDVVEALRLLIKAGVGKSYSGLRSLCTEVARQHTALSAIAADLGVDVADEKPRRRK